LIVTSWLIVGCLAILLFVTADCLLFDCSSLLVDLVLFCCGCWLRCCVGCCCGCWLTLLVFCWLLADLWLLFQRCDSSVDTLLPLAVVLLAVFVIVVCWLLCLAVVLLFVYLILC
jgi:hypothetical protein